MLRVVNYFNLVKRSSQGFTLLEGIIALGVISVGLVAALTLAVANLTTSENNQDRIVAANLAREEIEAVRNMRDSNWLRAETHTVKPGGGWYSWDDFIDASGVSVAPVFAVTVTTPPAYRFNGVSFLTPSSVPGCSANDYLCACVPTGLCAVKFDTASGVYGQDGQETKFHRLIRLQDICYNDAANLETVKAFGTGCGTDKVGTLVTAEVLYGNKSAQRVIAKERLYNWR